LKYLRFNPFLFKFQTVLVFSGAAGLHLKFDRKTLCWVALTVVLTAWLCFGALRYTNQIVVVPVVGPVYSFEPYSSMLTLAKKDPYVRGVILYLDTPGGLAYPCLEIGGQVKALRDVKPVYAVMGGECASGGYYIASFADKIYTHRNTVTGAIGVLAVWMDYSEYYEKQGIKVWVWSTGKEKDFGAPWRPPTEEEKAKIQAEVDRIFRKLLDDIKANRETLTVESFSELKTGKVFLGEEAVRLGLADEIGDLHKAVEDLADLYKLQKPLYITVPADMDYRLRFLYALGIL